MIANRSICYHKLRQNKSPEIVYASVQPIRNLITQLNIAISNFQQKLNKQSLPSFRSRERRTQEIETAKDTINEMVKELDTSIKRIDIPEMRMCVSIQTYFFRMLKKIILFYRTLHQESLKRHEEYNDHKPVEICYEDERLLQMTVSRVSHIRHNIFSLTNTLLELKMVLKDQTSMIDRIDFYFDKSNMYLERANDEIEKLPEHLTGFKDFAIYCLIYVLCILLVLALIKTARNR